MRRNSRNVLAWGAIGAVTGIMLMPITHTRTRRKISRSARNAYFKASDFLQDMKDK